MCMRAFKCEDEEREPGLDRHKDVKWSMKGESKRNKERDMAGAIRWVGDLQPALLPLQCDCAVTLVFLSHISADVSAPVSEP